ncbi:MAG: dUTP diphosphatase [Kiritimatiellaeota bacterium]|nr:dUTP diphosphatase [Kiritimatiellota bacterium]
MFLKIKLLSSDAQLPRYAHPDDSGMDLSASADVVIAPGTWALVPTGIAIELPPGTEAQIRPRSGLAARNAITVLNAPATIDEGYRGEIKIILINHGAAAFEIKKGMRIAQMVICPVLRPTIVECDTFTETVRSTSGFGSTGV